MSIEAEIKALREAIEANTAAIQGAAKSGANKPAANADDDGETTTTTRRGRGASNKGADEKTTKYTAEQVKAAAVKVKDVLGSKVAKQIIKDHGADELAALKSEVYDDFVAACQKALKDAEENNDDSL